MAEITQNDRQTSQSDRQNNQYDRTSIQFDRQNQFDRSNTVDRDLRQASEQFRRTAEEERGKNERLANRLSREALQQWQRSVDGLLALPTATALGLASTTLYIAAFIERGFEVIQQTTESLRLGAEQGRRDLERYDGEDRGDSRRLRDRNEYRGEYRGELRAGGEQYRGEQYRGESRGNDQYRGELQSQGGQIRGNLEVRGDVQPRSDA